MLLNRRSGAGTSLVDRIALRWADRTEAPDAPPPVPADLEQGTVHVPEHDPGPDPERSGHGRRSFLGRVTLAASALTVDPFRFLTEPVSAWDAVCGSGNTCGEGWSVFCCTINNGSNTCPSGSFVAGWWKSDASAFCSGGPRYILDCNQTAGVGCNCYCPTHSCDNRRTCCNQFRYGQCHTEIAAYGPVRCRLVSCIPPWQVDATCTTTSATDNRTSDHNAPCNDYTPPRPPDPPAPGALPSLGPVIQNGDGRLEAFGFSNATGGLVAVYQYAVGSGWSQWGPIGAGGWPQPNGVAIGRNANGRLQAFVRGASGQYNTSVQQPIGQGWSLFTALGGSFATPPVVGRNHDGRLEVFGVGTDGKLKHNWQTAKDTNTWYGWVDFGGSFAAPPSVGTTTDGRMFATCIGTDGTLYGVAQNKANGVWTPLVAIASGMKGTPVIARNTNGQLIVAGLTTAGKLRTFKPQGFGWAADQTLDATMAGTPVVGVNTDSRLEIFCLSPDGVLHHTWQSSPAGPFVQWFPMAMPTGVTFTSRLAVVSNDDGRLEVFARGTDARLWHDFQIRPSGTWYGPTHLGGTLAE